MFLKLGIIVSIVIIGGVMFSSEITTLFPNTSATAINSLKDDVNNLSSQATNSTEKRISESFDNLVDKTNDTVNKEINKIGNKITNKISESKESSQTIIIETVSNLNPLQSIQNIFTEDNKP